MLWLSWTGWWTSNKPQENIELPCSNHRSCSLLSNILKTEVHILFHNPSLDRGKDVVNNSLQKINSASFWPPHPNSSDSILTLFSSFYRIWALQYRSLSPGRTCLQIIRSHVCKTPAGSLCAYAKAGQAVMQLGLGRHHSQQLPLLPPSLSQLNGVVTRLTRLNMNPDWRADAEMRSCLQKGATPSCKSPAAKAHRESPHFWTLMKLHPAQLCSLFSIKKEGSRTAKKAFREPLRTVEMWETRWCNLING